MGVYFEGKHIQKLSDLPAELTCVYNSQDLEPLREWFYFSKHIHNGYGYRLKNGQWLKVEPIEIQQNINGFFYEADMIAELPSGKNPLRLLFIPPVLDGNYLLSSKINGDHITGYEDKLYWTCYKFSEAFYEYMEIKNG